MRKFFLIISAVLLTADIYSQDGFGSIFDSEEAASKSQNIMMVKGEIGFNYKTYFDDSWDSERIISPFADMDILFSSETAEGKITLNIDAGDLDSNITFDTLVDELYLRSFFPFGYLDLGLFKTEWGKGDGIHVIDPLNPLDQSDGPSSDLNEMKKSEVMAKMNFYIGDGGLLELVYKPYFHPVTMASEGRWVIKDLPFPLETSTIPDTEAPSWSQAAARFTTTFGSFDFGGTYYYGYMTEPGFKISYTDPFDLSSYRANITYTKAQLFGLEAVLVKGPFTFRAEGGYWLSEDHEGTEAHLYNDRAVWLAGFDIMLPGTSVFLSVQEFGSYVLNFDSTNPMDMDLGMSYNENAVTNTIVVAMESSFFRDKMKISLTGLYLFEAEGYMILPEYMWSIGDNLEFSVKGQIYGGEDEGPDPYYAWRNNDSLTVGLKYIF